MKKLLHRWWKKGDPVVDEIRAELHILEKFGMFPKRVPRVKI